MKIKIGVDYLNKSKLNDDEELNKIREKKLLELHEQFMNNGGGSESNWPSEPVVLSEDNFEDFVKVQPFKLFDCSI